ncbi:MAG: RNA polymerase sigma factor [Myxococcales bacterium]|nr:RNA polymerase sigma factor [Myxococcales bacterium]
MTTKANITALTDEELMTRYQKGDTSAFEALLDRYHRPIYNLILRMIGQRELAEDLLQDTFIRVINGAASFTQQARFKTWLYTIARNISIDAMRKRKYRRARSLDEPMNGEEGRTMVETIGSDEPTSDRRVDDQRFKGRLEEALAALSDEQREVFVMRQFDGLAFKEIAEVVGTSENTIKSRMRYALENLRAALKDFYP